MDLIQSLQDRSEHGLRRILENIQDFVVVLDREGRFLYINHVRDEDNFREALGKSIFQDQWISKETQGNLRAALADAFKEGKSSQFEMLGIAIGDHAMRHWYSSRLHPIKVDDKVIAAVYVSTEITNQKRAQQTITDQKDLQDAILAAMSDGVFALDSDDRVTLWNRAMERMSGMKGIDLIGSGKPIGDFLPTLSKELLDGIRDELEAGELVRRDRTVYDAEGKNGRDYTAYYHPLKLEAVAHGMVGVVRDVTKSRRAQAEREAMQERMRGAQKLESLGVLAGGIAHDFNNLLVLILGYAELAQLELPENSPADGMLNQIRMASQKAADLCRQMLAYAGKGKFVVKNVDVNCVIREMLGLLEVSISKKATLTFELSPEPLVIDADASQISQVIMNLIINAADAIGDHNGIITIHTRICDCDARQLQATWHNDTLQPGRYTEIEIRDTGCGMDQDTIARIFEPFFTTKFSGRGLGMAAVLGIVRSHNGGICIQSEPGKGSTFKVIFPFVEGTQEIVPAASPRSDTLQGCTVLAVDDDPHVLEFLDSALGMLGMNVLTASGGQEAIGLFSRNNGNIQLVILDMTMPGLDGVETSRQLRRLRPDVRIVLSSGYNEQEAVNRFANDGLAAFLQKPFTLQALQSTIAEAIREPVL